MEEQTGGEIFCYGDFFFLAGGPRRVHPHGMDRMGL